MPIRRRLSTAGRSIADSSARRRSRHRSRNGAAARLRRPDHPGLPALPHGFLRCGRGQVLRAQHRLPDMPALCAVAAHRPADLRNLRRIDGRNQRLARYLGTLVPPVPDRSGPACGPSRARRVVERARGAQRRVTPGVRRADRAGILKNCGFLMGANSMRDPQRNVGGSCPGPLIQGAAHWTTPGIRN